jgi:hypothetical protein
LFWKLDGEENRSPESIAWILRAAGLAALVTAWFTRRVEEDGCDESGEEEGYGDGLVEY